jgi:hypothetical protein
MLSTGYSSLILMNIEFSRQFFEEYSNIKFHKKNLPMGTELFHADWRTDRAKLIIAFRNFGNAPKNSQVGKVFGSPSCYLCSLPVFGPRRATLVFQRTWRSIITTSQVVTTSSGMLKACKEDISNPYTETKNSGPFHFNMVRYMWQPSDLKFKPTLVLMIWTNAHAVSIPHE